MQTSQPFRCSWLVGMLAVTISTVSAADLSVVPKPERYDANDYSFVRIFDRAAADARWDKAETVTAKMVLVSEYAIKEFVVSDPVSDRYVITCYGGPIDLVHFFNGARAICSGKALTPYLYKAWVDEGGRENRYSFDYNAPPEAHPDDLPSDALGGWFGFEMRRHNDDPNYDLLLAFTKYLEPFIFVPDKIAKTFSHRDIVMDLAPDATREQKESRYGWFTAAPMLQCRKLNEAAVRILGAPICEEISDPELALAEAGFKLTTTREIPVIIRRKH